MPRRVPASMPGSPQLARAGMCGGQERKGGKQQQKRSSLLPCIVYQPPLRLLLLFHIHIYRPRNGGVQKYATKIVEGIKYSAAPPSSLLSSLSRSPCQRGVLSAHTEFPSSFPGRAESKLPIRDTLTLFPPLPLFPKCRL